MDVVEITQRRVAHFCFVRITEVKTQQVVKGGAFAGHGAIAAPGEIAVAEERAIPGVGLGLTYSGRAGMHLGSGIVMGVEPLISQAPVSLTATVPCEVIETMPADGGLVLRTHTSPVQARTMLTQEPPIYVICPGRVYRTDELDATHTPVFMQVEGLVVDEGITFVDLKATLAAFARRIFGPGTKVRFRPSFFPFTEPSAEMDVRCDRSGGDVKIGQGSDWMEIVGCGMVHPNVLRNCGLDPDQWQGFAFGFGVDRLGMLKYGMPDLRDMFASDVRWLEHFGFSAFQAPNPATGLS